MKFKFKFKEIPDFEEKCKVDKKFKYYILWWPMFWIYVSLNIVFFVLSLLCFISSVTNQTIFSIKTMQTLDIINGALMMLLFALFWIVNAFINNRAYPQRQQDELANKLASSHRKWHSTYRICGCVIAAICGLTFISAGFFLNKDALINVSFICSIIAFWIYTVCAILGVVAFVLFIKQKTKMINLIVNSQKVEITKTK